ncbi:hypothetical protein ABKN59_008943 [Abortiporus biennis]
MSKDTLFLSHIISQTQANVSFLAAHDYLSAADASDIMSRLAAAQTRGITSGGSAPRAADITSGLQDLSISAPTSKVPKADKVPKPAPPPPAPRTQKARALWAYNENGQEPNDLSFSAGETIEIVSETNPDWWTGKCRGKQGLFPSNHVEKIDSASTSTPPAPAPGPSAHNSSPWMPSAPSGSSAPDRMMMPGFAPPPPGPPQSYYQPPPPMGYQPPGYQGYGPPPPGPNPAPYGEYREEKYQEVGKEQKEEKEKKKSKFGGLGNTMATAAAGGVGFGAGAAIGGGIIDAIF